MRRIITFCIALLFSSGAFALDWICSVGHITADSVRGGNRTVHRFDLAQSYAGQPVLMGSTWLVAFMLPANHPDSQLAFSQIGLNALVAEKLARSTGLVDRGIRVVQSPEEMLVRVGANHPAVGYVPLFKYAPNVVPCF